MMSFFSKEQIKLFCCVKVVMNYQKTKGRNTAQQRMHLFLLFALVVTEAHCQDWQFEILMDLYNSTNGPGWVIKNWGNTNVCNWDGVQCDDTKSVTTLRLSSNRMSGSIPDSLGK